MPEFKKIDLVVNLMEKYGLFDDDLEHDIRELLRKTWWAGHAAGETKDLYM